MPLSPRGQQHMIDELKSSNNDTTMYYAANGFAKYRPAGLWIWNLI
jgi:hypothetical protein